MVVGVLELCFAVPAFSLKEKRSVVRRICARTKNKFNVAIAETEDLDSPSDAVLGVVTVSNDAKIVHATFQKIERFVDELHLAEITHVQQHIEHY